MHEVLVNRLGGLSLPRKSVVRLTDRPDMTLDVYRGRKTTNQQHISLCLMISYSSNEINLFGRIERDCCFGFNVLHYIIFKLSPCFLDSIWSIFV